MREWLVMQLAPVPAWAWVFLGLAVALIFALWWIVSLDLRLRYRQMAQAAVVAKQQQTLINKRKAVTGLPSPAKRRLAREQRRRKGYVTIEFLASVMVYFFTMITWTAVSYGHLGGALTSAGLATMWLIVREK